jgi:hypothetical protein
MFILSIPVGYVPKTIKKGEDEYMIVVQGVQDTGTIIKGAHLFKQECL